MLEVRAQDSSAELCDIGNDEARPELCPAYKLGRFWIDNHPGVRCSESTTAGRKKNGLLVEFGNKVVGGDRLPT